MDESTKAKIILEISKIDTLISKSSILLEKCKVIAPDFLELNAIGSILHSYYNGLENIFKLIHKATGGESLTSTMWHSNLFYSMFEKTETRPAVLPEDLRVPLKEYLGFRHVFRHSYGYELDWERLNPLFSGVSENWQSVKASIQGFIQPPADEAEEKKNA